MKYINTFEKFSNDEVIELPVNWASSYNYNGNSYMLKVGDMTNKGEVIEVVEDIHTWYITDQGSYSPRDLIVLKTKKELDENKII